MDIDKPQSVSTVSSTIAKGINASIHATSCSLITSIIPFTSTSIKGKETQVGKKMCKKQHVVLNGFPIEEFFSDEFNESEEPQERVVK
ncbi:15432_t:CDS:2 [Funneliformis mosseae]|uniref:15432_t:CDS:1 n=1 Tax=Funneliformis mosseae TaxID=27381 RepID=A0A9N9HDY1_FUNMO|nr:15432_t:CDS:2 [Funneliformis mosseae]